jgi:hypothetical protein
VADSAGRPCRVPGNRRAQTGPSHVYSGALRGGFGVGHGGNSSRTCSMAPGWAIMWNLLCLSPTRLRFIGHSHQPGLLIAYPGVFKWSLYMRTLLLPGTH